MTAAERYLEGRHAIVTGGGKGIGAAIAEELARLGASLTVMGRDRDALRLRGDAIRERHGTGVHAMHCDVANESSVAGAFGEARRTFGEAYILVNNAGVAPSAPLAKITLDSWQDTIGVNLTGAFLCTRAVLAGMLERKEGRIVNIASTAALRGYSRTAAYTASKHGLLGLTRALAMEVGKEGITVNAVCPGYTDTGMAAAAVDNLVKAGRSPDEAKAMLERSNPGGRLITPAEVASTVGWLCSPSASAINGQAIVVAGGVL